MKKATITKADIDRWCHRYQVAYLEGGKIKTIKFDTFIDAVIYCKLEGIDFKEMA